MSPEDFIYNLFLVELLCIGTTAAILTGNIFLFLKLRRLVREYRPRVLRNDKDWPTFNGRQ